MIWTKSILMLSKARLNIFKGMFSHEIWRQKDYNIPNSGHQAVTSIKKYRKVGIQSPKK